jgi:hypothetical protein
MQATAVKERPILFSAPMVQAILNGTKTQTRRIVKPQPPDDIDALHGNDFRNRAPYSIECDDGRLTGQFGFQYDDQVWNCPYGKAGERLWVRENSARAEAENGDELRVYQADMAIADVYQLDCGPKSLNGFRDEKWTDSNGRLKFTPSIHMPRWASRITLEITGVRVERLQDINHKDARAEGMPTEMQPARINGEIGTIGWIDPTYWFGHLWADINGVESWKANPWVWVIEFRKAGST